MVTRICQTQLWKEISTTVYKSHSRQEKIQIKSSQWNKIHNIKAPIIINNINFLSTKTSLHGQCTRQYKHLQEMRSCNFGDDTKEYFSSSQESLGLIIAEGKTGLYITGQSYGPYFTRQTIRNGTTWTISYIYSQAPP